MVAPLRVLLLEDSDEEARRAAELLRRGGFDPQVRCVSTEPAFAEALKGQEWDIVVADRAPPNPQARLAASLVKQTAPDVPLIFVSSSDDLDAAEEDHVFQSSPGHLVATIRRALHEAELRRALRQAEQRARESEARFRSLVENINEIFLILDPGGAIRFHSPSVERLLGYSVEEFAGTNILEYVHPDDWEIARTALARPAGEPRPPVLPQCRVRHRNGTWRVLEGLVTNLVDDPAVGGLVCTARDVTHQRRIEAERLRAQRLESLGSLAGGIAHDLNNLLTPILVTAEMLEGELTPEERESLLGGLRASAGRATEIVQHLLSFARGGERRAASAEAGELIRDLERLLKFSLPKSIRQRFVVPPGLWPILGDASEILQVLMNLCVNARDAMPSGGRLTVDAANVVLRMQDIRSEGARPGPFVRFQVIDTGIGMSPEVQKRMFEPFFTTKAEAGTGLGLPTSVNIIQRRGGLLRVYSEVGRGTRFSVYLPATTAPAAEQILHDLPRGDGEMILVADDEASVREIMREMLEAHGYRVLAVGNGAEALAVHAENREAISLAVVDVAMPLLDGPATVRALRHADPGLPILVQGGFVLERRQEFPEDIQDFLEKPYTTERLILAVAQHLRRHTIQAIHS